MGRPFSPQFGAPNSRFRTRHTRVGAALPAGVAGVGFRQPVDDLEALAKRLQRAGEVGLLPLHVANLDMRNIEIALPSRVAGIGFPQPVSDREALTIGGQRPGEVALSDLYIAHFIVRD
jgi:hypothetical protein